MGLPDQYSTPTETLAWWYQTSNSKHKTVRDTAQEKIKKFESKWLTEARISEAKALSQTLLGFSIHKPSELALVAEKLPDPQNMETLRSYWDWYSQSHCTPVAILMF